MNPRLVTKPPLLCLWLATSLWFSAEEQADPSALLPEGTVVVSVDVHPERVELNARHEYSQLLLSGRTESGEVIDLTRSAVLESSSTLVEVSERGLVRPLANGEDELVFSIGDLTVRVPVVVRSEAAPLDPSFLRDVMPIISRAGCNAGGCHGSADGQNGFKLSLRGYDPSFDHAALTDDLAARRFNRVSPEQSLFLLKPTASVPHEGGQLLRPGSDDYEVLRTWVANGVKLDLDGPRVTGIEVLPRDPSIPLPGMSQQVAVLATYSDGRTRDVTAHAFIETNDTEVTEVDEHGLVTAVRRGEAAILARYEGQYAASRLLVMDDREGYEWNDAPENNYIDTLVYEKLRNIRSLPSESCTDADFIRRVYLDLAGIPPTARETSTFLMDSRDQRLKREELIDRLIGSADFVAYWTNKWSDLLQVNSKFLGQDGAEILRRWIRASVASNQPYDQFVNEILTGSGSTYENPPAAYYKVLREPDEAMENTTQLFLGIRFSCNKCHDHPFERWTQKQHWQLAAYFGGVTRQGVEGASALPSGAASEEIISDGEEGEVLFPDTDVAAVPAFPYEHAGAVPAEAPRREQIAAWLTAPENPYFAKSFVNRLWSYFLGVGLIDPVDDIRAGNPPTNPELLDRMTREFIASGFDVRELMRAICRSRVYQHSIESNRWNELDEINYSHAMARRLPAEVLFDAVHRATGSRPHFSGVRSGTRAIELVDASVKAQDGFLDLFGRPARESACECERVNTMSLGQALNLVNGPTVADAIRDPANAIADLVAVEEEDAAIIEELYLSFLCRLPSEDEVAQLAPTFDVSDIANRTALSPADDLELATRLGAWEAEVGAVSEWMPLETRITLSVAGATLDVADDRSILVSGAVPEKDTYSLVAFTRAEGITGIRLEVLPDTSLPAGGPGRAENGNFVLNEITVTAVPVGTGPTKSVALSSASADFSQDGWPVTAAIDGQPETGWAVSPRFGKSHLAIFETQEDTGAPGGTLLIVNLDQQYGGMHTIGRLRLSVTTSARPVRHHGLPDAIANILATATDQRTAEEQAQLYAYFVPKQADLVARIRLGAAQDLAWGLVNSPAFLFNR